MSQTLRPAMTEAEFLRWEARQEGHYEFDGHGIAFCPDATFDPAWM